MRMERHTGTWAKRLGVAVAAAALIPATPAAAGVTNIPTPNPGTTNLLGGLVAFSPTDIWGVGSASSTSYTGCHGRTLTIHSSGSAFTEVPETPQATPMCASVNGVAGRSATDIWAVGSTNNGRDTFVRHWNGAVWTGDKGATIPVPPSGGRAQRSTGLNGVAALGAQDVWAVGRAQFPDFGRRALIEHYTGTWQLVPGPPDTGGVLNGISALGANDLWAVGAAGGKTLVTRWNGTTWATVPSPNTNVLNTLRGVSARAADDVWAVGDAIKSQSDGVSVSRTLIEHWNGTAWSVVSSPNVGTSHNFLTGVAARGPGDAFAVGYYVDASGDIPVQRTLWLRWNGVSWRTVPSPNLGPSDNSLLGVIAPPGTSNAWAWGNAGSTLAQKFTP
jgi:hypothetical protein